MGWEEVAEGLARRARLFERCYLEGFVSYLAGIQRCADYLAGKRFDILNEGQLVVDIEAQLRVLNEFYSNMPGELSVIEPCSAYILEIDEFWGRYYDESRALLKQGRCNMARLSSAESVLECACESLLRCASLEGIAVSAVERTQKVVRLIKDVKNKNLISGEDGKDLRKSVDDLLYLTDIYIEGFADSYSCDDEFSPVVVSCYLFQDFKYWTGEFISSRSYESLEQMTNLSLAMCQLMVRFKRNYDRTINLLCKLPSLDENKKESAGDGKNIYLSSNLGKAQDGP